MEIPHKFQDIVLYAIIVTGAFTFLGTLISVSVAISPISNHKYVSIHLYPAEYGPVSVPGTDMEYDQVYSCYATTIALTVIFGVGLVACWFLGRPTSTLSIAWIFQLIAFFCCFGKIFKLSKSRRASEKARKQSWYTWVCLCFTETCSKKCWCQQWSGFWNE